LSLRFHRDDKLKILILIAAQRRISSCLKAIVTSVQKLLHEKATKSKGFKNWNHLFFVSSSSPSKNA